MTATLTIEWWLRRHKPVASVQSTLAESTPLRSPRLPQLARREPGEVGPQLRDGESYCDWAWTNDAGAREGAR